jgi:hypothetical protein
MSIKERIRKWLEVPDYVFLHTRIKELEERQKITNALLLEASINSAFKIAQVVTDRSEKDLRKYVDSQLEVITTTEKLYG